MGKCHQSPQTVPQETSLEGRGERGALLASARHPGVSQALVAAPMPSHLEYREWKQRGPDNPHPVLAYVPSTSPAGRRAGVHSLGWGHLNVEGGEGPRGPKGAFQETWPFLSGASPEMLRLPKVTAQG